MKSLRSDLSERNPAYISKYRYLELKNFCLQYKEFKKFLSETKYLNSVPITKTNEQVEFHDRTGNLAIKRSLIKDKIHLIEQTIMDVSDGALFPYILEAVTTGKSYEVINSKTKVPCGRRQFYKKYREFFWLLDKRIT